MYNNRKYAFIHFEYPLQILYMQGEHAFQHTNIQNTFTLRDLLAFKICTALPDKKNFVCRPS